MKVGTLEIEIMASMAKLTADLRNAEQTIGNSMGKIERSVSLAKDALIALGAYRLAMDFVSSLKATIETTAALTRLSVQTGATVESLSALSNMAAIVGTDIESVAMAMNRMSKGMAVANESSKGVAQAVAALGLDFNTFKAMRPDEQMMAVAKAMDQFSSSGDKAAIAMTLYGRSGARMLPLLAELATAGEYQATVTAEQSAQAEDFEHNLRRVEISSAAVKRELTIGMVPALDDAAKAVLQVMNQSGGLRDQLRALVADGSIEKWTRNTINFLSYAVDAVQIASIALQSLWKTAKLGILIVGDAIQSVMTAGAAAKSGHLSDASDAIKAGYDKTVKNTQAYLKEMNDLQNTQLVGAKLRDEMLKAQIRKMAEPFVEQDNRAKLNFDANAAKAAKVAQDKITEYEKLNAELDKRIALERSTIESGGKVSEVDKFNLDLTAKLTDAKGKLTAAERDALIVKGKEVAALLLVADEQKKALATAQERQKAREEEAKGIAAFQLTQLEADNARHKSAKDRLEQIEFDTAALTMNAQEVAKATAIRKLEHQGIKQGTQDWTDYGQAILDATPKYAEMQKSIGDFKKVWDSVDKSAHDAFVNIFEGGKNAFTKLRDTLKATLLDLLYQMTLRKWIFNLTANITGASSGVAGAVAQASGMGGSSGGFLSSIFGGGGSGGGSAVGGGFMDTIRNFGSLSSFSNIGALASGGSIMGAVGAALPYLGAAMAIASLFSGGGGGPKTEAGYASGGLSVAGIDIGGKMQGSQRGDVAAAQKISEGMSSSWEALETQLNLVKRKLDVGIFYSMDNAKGGTSLTQLQVTSSTGYNRSNRAGGIENVARGEESLKTALAEETTRVMFDALKASNLPEMYKAWLDAVASTASTSDMQKVIDHVVKARTEQATLEETLYQLTATDIEKLARTRQRERDAVDPTNQVLLEQVYAQQDLKVATAESTAAIANIVAGMQAVSKSAGDSIFQMQYGMGTNQEKYNMLDVRGATQDAQMRSATAISDIVRLAQDEISTVNQAWSLLTLEQQVATYQQFETRLKGIDDFVAGRGAEAITAQGVKDAATAATIAAAVEAAMDKANARTAAQNTASADLIAASAAKPAVALISVTVTKPPSVEVSVSDNSGYGGGSY